MSSGGLPPVLDEYGVSESDVVVFRILPKHRDILYILVYNVKNVYWYCKPITEKCGTVERRTTSSST